MSIAAAPRTAADRVYAALRAEIVDGMLAAGSPLTEVEQADRRGVSRTPVREALARLVNEGLVLERGPRSLVVSDIDRTDVDAMFDLRRALDEQAARIAAHRGDPDTFASLAARLDRAPALLAADRAARTGYYSLVAEFDDALDSALSTSPYLRAALQRLRVHLERVRRLAHDDDARLVRAAAEHAAIARAIADRDPERAAAATRLHLHEALTSIHAHLPRSGESTKETP